MLATSTSRESTTQTACLNQAVVYDERQLLKLDTTSTVPQLPSMRTATAGFLLNAGSENEVVIYDKRKLLGADPTSTAPHQSAIGK